MSRLKLEAVAVLVLVLLAACGDEDAGPFRSGVQETSNARSGPTRPRHPHRSRVLTSIPMTVNPCRPASPTPLAGETGTTSTPSRRNPCRPPSATPPASPAVVADRQASDSPEEALAEVRQLVRVRRDDLVISVSINGSSCIPQHEDGGLRDAGHSGEPGRGGRPDGDGGSTTRLLGPGHSDSPGRRSIRPSPVRCGDGKGSPG